MTYCNRWLTNNQNHKIVHLFLDRKNINSNTSSSWMQRDNIFRRASQYIFIIQSDKGMCKDKSFRLNAPITKKDIKGSGK